ncbi:MAG: DUF11 domain-containing protein, partial [Verrucomicrobiota bacterium]
MKYFLFSVLSLMGLVVVSPGTTTINDLNRFGYGSNIGWINWQANTNHGVEVGSMYCTGFAWSASSGWINLGRGPTNHCQYGNTTVGDTGVNVEEDGALRGLAWGAAIGWIKFESRGDPRIDLESGRMSGFAYGANVGWIGLSNMNAFVQTDSIEPSPLAGLDPDLAMTKTVDREVLSSFESNLVYTIQVRNIGSGVAPRVTVSDAVPVGFNVTSSVPAATSISNGIWTWDACCLGPGQAFDVTLFGAVNSNAPGILVNTATGTTGGNDNQAVNNTDSAGTTIISAGNTNEYRMKITFCGYDGFFPLFTFPALIVLSSNLTGFSYADFLSPEGHDLRFYSSNFVFELAYEIE